jgi:hypothetical protein
MQNLCTEQTRFLIKASSKNNKADNKWSLGSQQVIRSIIRYDDIVEKIRFIPYVQKITAKKPFDFWAVKHSGEASADRKIY